MPYQGSTGSATDSSSAGTVSMPTQAPADLGTGSGGLMQIGTTGVVGQSGTTGANLPVDALQQASTMILQGKADLSQTAGAENRLDGFDGVGGGGGGTANANGTVAANTANENTSSTGLGGVTTTGTQTVDPGTVTTAGDGTSGSVVAASDTGTDGLDPRSQDTGATAT